MRRAPSLLLLALLVLPAGAASPAAPRRDIDVGIPPGTPLEWSRELFRPLITARHGVIPPRPGEAKPEIRERATVVEERVPEPMLTPFGQTGLYDHFRVTTVDIMRHVVLSWPRRGKYDPDVPSAETPDLIWEYPPTYPTEIYWGGALNALRGILHPEVVPVRELSAYLLEMGECALVASRSLLISSTNTPLSGPLPLQGYPVYNTEVTDQRPPLAGGETPLEQAIFRLVVVELTNGFPYAIDPTYAKRTLALGREAEWALIELSKSKHTFLARNATAILGSLPFPAARERLREIVQEGKDPIMWVRAVMALTRHRDLEIVRELEKWITSEDKILSTVALHAIGVMADPRPLPRLLKLARETDDPDVLWAVLPAIVRTADDKPEVMDTLKAVGKKRLKPVKRQAGAGGFVPPKPEPGGTRDEILGEMVLLGRVVAGDVRQKGLFLAKARKKGAEGFKNANRRLVIDVLRRVGKGGRQALLKILGDRKTDRSLRVAALNALRPVVNSMKADLKKLIENAKEPSVLRTTALLALAELEETASAREAALNVVNAYLKRTKGAPPYESAVVATAIQVLSSTRGGLPTDKGIAVVEKAFRDRAWGFRITRDSTRLTRSIIYSQPPLLEIAVVELGRTGDIAAIPVLIRVLRSRAGGGRAQAALALGAYGGQEATLALLNALGDAVSGWVRFNAYRALKRISGRDHYDDWVFSPPVLVRNSIRDYRDWWKSVQK